MPPGFFFLLSHALESFIQPLLFASHLQRILPIPRGAFSIFVVTPGSAADGTSTSSAGGLVIIQLILSTCVWRALSHLCLGETRQPFLLCDPVLTPFIKHRVFTHWTCAGCWRLGDRSKRDKSLPEPWGCSRAHIILVDRGHGDCAVGIGEKPLATW